MGVIIKKNISNIIKLIKRYLLYLFRFDIILKLFEFYVFIITVLAVLVTIKIWDIEVKPELKILKPIYCFNAQGIFESINLPVYKNIINKSDTLKNMINPKSIWNEVILAYFYDYPEDEGVSNVYAAFDFIKPNREVEEVSGYVTYDEWYLMGIKDTFSYLQHITSDLKANRSEREKLKNIYLLLGKSLFYDSDSLKKTDSIKYKNKDISNYSRVKVNPLQLISNLDVKDTSFLGALIYSQTKIYSCLSICNNSNQTIENLKITINDVWFYGVYSLFGWTLSANIIDIKKSPNTLQFTVDRLEGGQSIEVLIKGKKYIRDNDIKLVYSGLTYIDKELVIKWMVIIGIGVLLFHFVFWYIGNIRITKPSK